MPGLRNTPAGLELDVHIQPGARRTALAGLHAQRLKIALQAPPVDGKANDALTRFVAETFGVPRASVTIARGGKSRDKTLRIEGLSAEQADQVLSEVAAPGKT